MGKRDEADLERVGVNASRGPREGVVAVKLPDGAAVRKVPLICQLEISLVLDQNCGKGNG